VIRLLAGVVLGAAVAAASVVIAAPPAGTLRLCADPDNLPFSSASGPQRGLYVEVGALLAARLGMTPEMVWWRTFYARRALRKTLLAETCDAHVGLPFDTGYMDRQVTVTRPFLDVGYAIMVPPGLTFTRLDDLKPHRLAVEFKTPPQFLLATRDGFSVSTFQSTEEEVEALTRHEVDAAFVWGPIAGYLNVTKLAGAYRIVPIAGDGMQWRIGVGVRKGDEALYRRIDEVLPALEPNIRRAAERYGFPLAPAVALTGTP
jgi:ABC-type amino acid transport substrate-binding protein